MTHGGLDVGRFVERDVELGAILGALARARDGEGTCMVIEGEPGIGKSSVLAAAVGSAEGVLVLRARGGELESEFGFGVVRQLLEGPVRGNARPASLFAGAARLAAPMFDVAVDGPTPLPPQDHVAPLHALYWVTANLTEESPVLLAIDDAQWADEPSLRYLAFISRRLEGLRLAMAIVFREGEGGATADALRATADDHGTRLRLAPLTRAGVTAVLESAIADTNDDLCRACHEATGGNPFYVREVVRSLQEASESRAEAVIGLSPARVRGQVASRLAHLDRPATDLAYALAVVGDGLPLRLVAAAAGLGVAEAGDAADVLATAAIVAPDRPLRFAHPIVRAAIYEQLGVGAEWQPTPQQRASWPPTGHLPSGSPRSYWPLSPPATDGPARNWWTPPR